MPFHQGLGPDGFAGVDVVLHDGAQYFKFAWFAHTPPPSRVAGGRAARAVPPKGLALDMPKC
jgi:hypothetical protein